ncbi:adenylate/guanylate cyclase domain-containing protein [Bradyrhizobium sp. BWC-3-1]|uniref:adenylate/guanylate cyclase domain-containing protein n=1 Tax=Bradyrhizobium sp. BWC-3-1 TaxID=3080012 RepID=UPI00293E7A20|nr:adenylate/guanylate cyclase domain-containing protein [Bradyrhizobium sp. BWC-3-1]WOH62523.1 adenylate/guanylate cyclase domain-containing protein [Bradyrhizobium sp. BWC-3-1]
MLAADVAGYSRLMGADEEDTLARLKAVRKALIDPTIAAHRGRIVKTTGDGMLVEFASAVDAVRGAVEVQHAMAEQNGSVPQDTRIEFRIGIHVGDIMFDDNDIFGDGVNIAARLEVIADPGGICISNDAYRQVRGKVEIVCDDLGPQPLKNIAEPMQAWRVRPVGQTPSAVTSGSALGETQALSLPDKPSIAVLPFQNMSGDLEQEYFADGIVEEIITALSRFRSLFVIARNSSFTYKGKAVDIKQVGREMGVRYVLEGSVRKAAGRVRITGQLIDTATGMHLWADRFDGATEDVFELQDQVTRSVVGAITPTLERAEIGRAVLKPTGSLDAYDHYMRGIASAYRWTSEATSEALRHYYRAIELDPEFATAHAFATTCYAWRKSNGWVTDAASEIAETKRLAERAVQLDQNDAQVLCWSGAALGLVCGEVDAGGALVERALRLNPNLMDAWLSSGLIRLLLRDWSIAIEHFAHAMRLSPFDPLLFMMQHGTAIGYFQTDRYDEAAAWSAKSIGENPNNSSAWRIMAASNALSGRQEQAQKAILRLRQIEPAARIATIKYAVPLSPSELARMEEGLRKAGLPE